MEPSGAYRVQVVTDVNLLSHPLATIAIGLLGWPLLLVETIVIATEGIGYRLILRMRWREAAVLSLIANALTTSIGWLAFLISGFSG